MGTMPSVRIGSNHEFLLLVADDPAEGAPQQLAAELRLDGLSAAVQVCCHYATGFEDLADFFQRLADEWLGWAGARTWESLEHELELEARHEYGHVQLRVTMRREGPGWGNLGWSVTGDLTIEPGERLSAIARDMRVVAFG